MNKDAFPRLIFGCCAVLAWIVVASCSQWPLAEAEAHTSTSMPMVSTTGAPERVAVIVNSQSWASQSVANEYIRLRHIPASNVIYMDLKDWPRIKDAFEWPSFEKTDFQTFKTKLLGPILEEIKNRGLAEQIDCIAYSSDFPYYIRVTNGQGDTSFDGYSLTGLTYLHELVMAVDGNGEKSSRLYLAADANRYFHSPQPSPATHAVDLASAGFSSQTAWDLTGKPADGADGGRHYMLCTMLAYTSGRGNSVSEAVKCLRSAASADGTCPKGTVFYGNNANIRVDVRRWGFDEAIAELKKMGIDARKTGDDPDPNHNPVLPISNDPIVAAMLGLSNIPCRDCKNTILPGAIIENMTSYGAFLGWAGEFQTSIADFVRLGAAGTSGTVEEPYAIWNKFPTPYMHVHYANGCTLAESFYQSTYMPYQLLILGDPLCAPWAMIPRVGIKDVSGGVPEICSRP